MRLAQTVNPSKNIVLPIIREVEMLPGDNPEEADHPKKRAQCESGSELAPEYSEPIT